tara:strand:+ start:953 stop:1606 length:654 start_codon:yes stop_codon:yes gene_type:complete
MLDRKEINLDLSNKCTLECPKCARSQYLNKKEVPGNFLSDHDWSLIRDYFKCVNFCGVFSDPIMHPKLPEMLRDCFERNIKTHIHVAASQKPKDFFEECFKANPKARWVFGIDGLPSDSHKHRVNQDGEKLFEMMKLSKKYVARTVWQYIIFNYNEHTIEEAIQMAKDLQVEFLLQKSARFTPNDPLRPSEEYVLRRDNNGYNSDSQWSHERKNAKR